MALPRNCSEFGGEPGQPCRRRLFFPTNRVGFVWVALGSAGDHPCGDRGAGCVQVAERGGFHRRPPQVIAWAAIRRGVTWTGPGLWRGSAWRQGPWAPLGVAWSGVRVEQRRRRRRDLGRARSSLLSCDNNCGPMLLAVSDLTTDCCSTARLVKATHEVLRPPT